MTRRSQSKEAALRDVPYLLRGVGLNLKDTMQDLGDAIHKRELARGFDPFDVNVPRSERLSVLQQISPHDNFATTLRYADMLSKRGVPRDQIVAHVRKNVFDPRGSHSDALFDQITNNSQPAQGLQPGEEVVGDADAESLRKLERAQSRHGAAGAALGRFYRAQQAPGPIPKLTHSVGVRAHNTVRGAVARADLNDPAVAQAVGLRAPDPTLRNRFWQYVGRPLVDVKHQIDQDGARLLVGTTGPKAARAGAPRDFSVPLTPLMAADSAELLAHELGHMRGNPLVRGALKGLYLAGGVPGLGALKLPEEIRAQSNAEDILDQFRSAGAPVRPKLQNMTDEELRDHTSLLGTYADAAVRKPVSMFYSALNKIRGDK